MPIRWYRWRVYGTMAVVLALVAIVASLLLYSGPRIRRVDSTLQHLAAGVSQVRIVMNQPLQPLRPGQVVVYPRVPYTVTAADNVITIQFAEKLYQGDAYTIELQDIRARHGGPSSYITHTIQPQPSTSTMFYDLGS
ncbi:MAG: hypothetical protein Q4A34_00895 [Candidatus Saccharibacteria bacterium]|nr:hypothetical protein [Candidatus Saccharibacteria bacterium]